MHGGESISSLRRNETRGTTAAALSDAVAS
jgi:hypothetical protein